MYANKKEIKKLLSVMFNGIILGAVYTLAAIGLSLQWGILKNLNFSHGVCITAGGYIMWVSLMGRLNYFLSFIIVVVAMFLVGMAIEKLTIQPFIFTNPANTFFATVALSSILSQVLLLIFGGRAKDLTPLVRGNFQYGIFNTTYHELSILFIAPIILLAMWLILSKTDIGMAIRAVGQDQEGAALLGINSKKAYGVTVGIATAIAGITGVLLGSIFYLTPQMGATPMIKAFIIVILGGLGSLKGTIIAAFIVALLEMLIGLYVGVTWGPIGLFMVMIIILLVRPEGLYGVKLRVG